MFQLPRRWQIHLVNFAHKVFLHSACCLSKVTCHRRHVTFFLRLRLRCQSNCVHEKTTHKQTMSWKNRHNQSKCIVVPVLLQIFCWVFYDLLPGLLWSSAGSSEFPTLWLSCAHKLGSTREHKDTAFQKLFNYLEPFVNLCLSHINK